MSEDINNINTDMKEMFIEAKYDKIEETFNYLDKLVVNEIILYNWNFIFKYYNEKKFDLLAQYIKFVAYNCYLTELANQKSYLDAEVFDEMMAIYDDIHENIKR